MFKSVRALAFATVALMALSSTADAGSYATTKSMDLVDTAVSAGSFSTLVAAIKVAGLVNTLKGDGPFTVFAPTDAAFAKLPEGAIESLLEPHNRGKLIAVLTYHVVPGRVLAEDIAGKVGAVKTVQGSDLAVDATGGSVRVDAAKVTSADIGASNGVIHVIDTVVVPSS